MTTSIENLLQLQKAAQAGAVSPDVAAWLEKVSNDCFSAEPDGQESEPIACNRPGADDKHLRYTHKYSRVQNRLEIMKKVSKNDS